MSTIIDRLRKGEVASFIHTIAADENIPINDMIQSILKGHVVIPRNNLRTNLNPIAIGKDTRIKINANIGTSPAYCELKKEMEKVKVAIEYGADTLMDLSIAGDIGNYRKRITSEYNVPLGAYSAQVDHSFREFPSICSGITWPFIPDLIVHLFRFDRPLF